jgi:transposase
MEYFSIKRPFFIVPSKKCNEEFVKIDKFMNLLENSGVGKIIERVKLQNKKCKGRTGYNPYNLLAAIIYCFSKFNATLRDIEDKCIFDIRVQYIMEGNVPDHSVIGDFINLYILPNQYEIFTCITKQIIKEFNLDTSDVYIDGTKLEANANKYKFVWKPLKFHAKLDIKIKSLLNEIGYSDSYTKNLIKAYDYNKILKTYAYKNGIDINSIPIGKGKRLTKEQKQYKIGYGYLIKLVEYEEKEKICGENRNSYFKTDHDATAMVLKEDYYSKMSHDFHAGYNIQVLVSSLLIMMYGVYQDRTDFNTLIPMNNLYFKYYNSYPINECDDAGYGNYKNYKYIREHNIGNYIKFQNFEGESSGKNPQLFYVFNDGVMCLDTNIGEIVPFDNNHQKRNKDGTLYKFNGCSNCNYSYRCKSKLKNKDENFRHAELIIDYEILKEQVRSNLLSPKGIEIRINRSIQVEGTFGQIKNNMNYDRIRRRGLDKVSVEIMLMCLGVNIRRYFSSYRKNKFKANCWNTPSDLQKEHFPCVKPKEKKLSRN